MRYFCFILTICAVLSQGTAQTEAADNPQRDFGFGEMEIYKINNGTHQLKAEDLDHDALADIIFLNNEKSRLEILFRKKKKAVEGTELLEDLFDNRGMMLDQQVIMYRLADLDGDKNLDVLTIGSPLGMYIRWQNQTGKFSEPMHIFLNDLQGVMTIQTADINEDGMEDIIVSRRKNAEILWNNAEHTFIERKTIAYTDDKCFWIETMDANEDGHLDLLQYYRDKEIPLKIRLGNGKGQFGPSHMLRIPRMKSTTVIRPRAGDPLMLAAILSNSLGMRLYKFEKSEQPSLLETQEFTPQRMAVPDKGSLNRLPWINSDFDSDGYDDLLAAAPAQSRLYLYKGDNTGLDPSALKYDTLSQISGLTLLADGDILAVSKKEKAIAIHRRKNMKIFPELPELKGELVSATAIKGTKSIFVIRRTDEALALDYYEDTEFKKTWPLELDNDPSSMQAFTMDDSKTGIILYIDYAMPEMLLVSNSGIEKVKAAQFRALSQNLKPGQVTELDPGSGETLIIAHGPTVRQYKWVNNSYKIVRQFNPMNEHAEANISCRYKWKKNKGLLVYDSNSKDLLWYQDGKTAEPKKIHIAGGGNFEAMVQLKNKNKSIFIMLSTKDIALLADKGDMLSLKSLGEYMSQSEKPSLRLSRMIEIGSPKRPALAIVDAANRAVEIVTKQEDGIKNELTFAAFLKSDMVGPSRAHTTEPHDISSADINGDGYDDMILLIHDKLLIYPGE